LVARGDIDAQMSVCIDIADYKWLTGSEAAAYLAELAASAEPLHISIERLRRGLSPVKAHLLLEQVELRRRAREKFTSADRMFFTRVGLEQATDEWVARYKAARFIAERAGACDATAASKRARSSTILRERGIGRLEIKKRGIEIDPEKLRRELKPRRDNLATLLITPLSGRLAQRIP
jgi:uncharacterized protein (DUF885 family)